MIQETKEGPRQVITFTGDTLLYDPQTHHYTTLDGEPLLSGSSYAEEFGEHFDRERLLPLVAKKKGQSVEVIAAAWELRGRLARDFGTSLHETMECWFKYGSIGYGVPKNPTLKKIVERFPLAGANILPEIMVSDLTRGLVGQIDGLLILDAATKTATIIDYKSDAEVEKGLTRHFNQLSFYAHILMAHGWHINEVQVWNYLDGTWEKHTSPVLPLDLHVGD